MFLCCYCITSLKEYQINYAYGGRNQFGLHFIKTGKIDKRVGKHYSKLFDLRQKGDYGDLFDYDAVQVEPLIPLTKEFIEEIKKLLDS